jgi:hypothetical protein
MTPKRNGGKPSTYTLIVLAILAVVGITGVVAYNLGYNAGIQYIVQKYGANIQSGTPLEVEDYPQLTADSDIVKRCISRCKSLRDLGLPVYKGMCVVSQASELNGFVCAVVVNDAGHCADYRKGVASEIVLNPACGFVGVYSPKGGE